MGMKLICDRPIFSAVYKYPKSDGNCVRQIHIRSNDAFITKLIQKQHKDDNT